eukprot:10425474-Alexandrium_andersonii.AAC.1
MHGRFCWPHGYLLIVTAAGTLWRRPPGTLLPPQAFMLLVHKSVSHGLRGPPPEACMWCAFAPAGDGSSDLHDANGTQPLL